MIPHKDRKAFIDLLKEGYLIPVELDVTNYDDEPVAYNLCDRVTTRSPGGSDCFRAEKFLVRPCDELMRDEYLKAFFANLTS